MKLVVSNPEITTAKTTAPKPDSECSIEELRARSAALRKKAADAEAHASELLEYVAKRHR